MTGTTGNLPTTQGVRRRRRSSKQENLRAHLLGEIASGVLSSGDALLAERELAEMMQLSRTTVRQTLDDMERDGIVQRVQGKGTFVTEKANVQSTVKAGPFGLIALDTASSYYLDLIAAFERFSGEVGYSSQVRNSKDDVFRQGDHILSLLDQRASGVLLNPVSMAVTPPYHVRMLQSAGIPVVLLHRGIPGIAAPVLEIPGTESGRQACQRAIEAGHRRVAFLSWKPSALEEQLAVGVRSALAEVGSDLPDELIDLGGDLDCSFEDYLEHESYLERVIERMLSSSDPPTALIFSWAEVAERVYLMAVRMGLRVPDDLSIICCGGVKRQGAILSRLTTITMDETAVAQRAVQLFSEMQAGRRPLNDAEVWSIPLGFAPGETLGRPAKHKVQFGASATSRRKSKPRQS